MGDQTAGRLARLGIFTVQDLLFHLPLRYQDRTKVTALGELRPAMEAVVVGKIELAEIGYGRRRSLLCRISDGTGSLTVRWFHFSPAQQRQLQRGRWMRAFGEIRPGRAGLELIHPEYQLSDKAPDHASDGLTPVYPATEGVTQGSLRRMVRLALQEFSGGLEDLIPQSLLQQLELPGLQNSVHFLHAPPADADLERILRGQDPAQQRLAFEELLAHYLSLRQVRRKRESKQAVALTKQGDSLDLFFSRLPFSLTPAQQRVCGEVLQDMCGQIPMLRLVQGDVGSGKTVVAAAAAVRSVENAQQAIVMAPTELLAEQHYRNFQQWLEPLQIPVGWLSGRLPAAQRRTTLAAIAADEIKVVIGTHALFQEQVEFARVGLVVVDEQHRFGVDQRMALWQKGGDPQRAPHQMIMTATPIPRTLAMTFYADLDVSSIDQLPPGRQPVETVAIPENRRADVVARIARACAEGRQAYWVCPLIEESDSLAAQAATETEQLLREALPDLRVGLVHGRLKPAAKDKVMARFRGGEIDLLVATTVIEVGVDVPNASLMIIENAERLGLSQLHQLRGRVGRGSQRAACVLLYRVPLSEHARIRLAALRDTSDGFEIARRDLELRGPGEVLGTRQTGLQNLRVADLARDRGLLPQVQKAGETIAQSYPERIAPLVRRWIGGREDYVVV